MHNQAAGDRVIGFLAGRKGVVITLAVLSLILAVFLVQTFGKAYRDEGYDFTSYLLSSQALFHGTNPYETGSPYPFIYPLFLCVVLYPLAVLPYWLSNVLWFLSGAAALYYSATALLRMRRDPLPYGEIITAVLIAFLLLVNVVQNNLLNGQVNNLVLLLCVLFLMYDTGLRRVVAPVLLAAAIAIKLTPLIFIPYLIIRREYRGAVMAAALAIIFAVGVPYAVAGPVTLEWSSRYISTILGGTMLDAVRSGDAGYSLTSFIRLIVPGAPTLWAFLLASIVSFAGLFRIQLASRGADPSAGQAPVFALYMLTILLLSPVSETHHLIFLFPAVLLVSAVVVHGSRSDRISGSLILFAVLAALILGRYWFPVNIAAIIALYVGMTGLAGYRDG